MHYSLWLYPPDPFHDRLRTLIQQLSVQGDGLNPIPFEPHVTIVGDIECEDDTAALQMCETLETQLRGQFTEGIHCKFHPNAESRTPLQWNQALVSILETTPSLMALVEASRNVLQMPIADVDYFAPPLRMPHLSLYYGINVAPDPATVPMLDSFFATELALWKTEPTGLEGVSEWQEVGRIRLV